jgi:hypothetical protein
LKLIEKRFFGYDNMGYLFHKMLAASFIFCGFAISCSIIGAIFGLPLAGLGLALWRSDQNQNQ